MDELCRLCCSSSFVQHDIFGSEGLHSRMEFVPVQVSLADGLPQRVCAVCRRRLLELHPFCSEAQRVQHRLRAMLAELQGEQAVKREPEPEPAPRCDAATLTDHSTLADCATQTDHATQTECEVIVKVEPLPGPPCWLTDQLGTLDHAAAETDSPQHGYETTTLIEIIKKDNARKNQAKTQISKIKVKREPLQMLQTDLNEQSYQASGDSNDFDEPKQFLQIHISGSDTEDDAPLIDLKKKKKNVKKKPKKKESAKSKAKPKKQKPKQVVKEEDKEKKDSDSDGLEELEVYCKKRRNRAPKTSKVTTDDPYACWCCICSVSLPSQAAALLHYEEHRVAGSSSSAEPVQTASAPTPLAPLYPAGGRCTLCRGTVPRARWQHHWARHAERPLHCGLCQISFSCLTDVVTHGVEYHAKEPGSIATEANFMCEFCKNTFTSMKSMLRHRSRDHVEAEGPARGRCARCLYRARSTACLVQHVRRKHAPARHLCAHCGKTFPGADKLKHHLVLHSGEKPFKCQYCPRGFAAAGTRRDHERTHTGEKPHVCPHCARAFVQRSALVAHVRALHAAARPHACALCGKGFATRALLTAHLKRPCVTDDGGDLQGRPPRVDTAPPAAQLSDHSMDEDTWT